MSEIPNPHVTVSDDGHRIGLSTEILPYSPAWYCRHCRGPMQNHAHVELRCYPESLGTCFAPSEDEKP